MSDHTPSVAVASVQHIGNDKNEIKPSFQAARRIQALKRDRISAVGNDTRATQHPGIPVNSTSSQVVAKCPRVVEKLNNNVYKHTETQVLRRKAAAESGSSAKNQVSGRPPGIEGPG